MNASKRIGVLVGGLSAERDASMRAAEAIMGVLRDTGHDAVPVFVDRDVDLALRQTRIEVAFLALRGRHAGNGSLQGLLDMIGTPYTGSGVLASALATNRAKTKDVLRLHNVPTAPGYVVRGDATESLAASQGSFGYPAIVRPVATGAAMAGLIVRDEMELEAAVEDVLRVDDEVLIERVVEGRSVCVAVLDGMALGAMELGRPGRGGVRSGELLTPSRVSPARYRSLLQVAGQAYAALGCEGGACIELVLSEKLNEIVVEVDTAPLLTPASPLPRIAADAGMSFDELVGELLAGARTHAHGHRRNRRAVQIAFEGHDRRASTQSAAH